MDEIRQKEIGAGALSLIRSHFELLTEGRLSEARAQLFFPPGMPDAPLSIYVEALSRMAPFQVLSATVGRFEDVRPRRHGPVAVVWVDVVVSSSVGERRTDMSVWWFPETDTYRISARPSHWVLEMLPGNEGSP